VAPLRETSAGTRYAIALWTQKETALKGRLLAGRCASWLPQKGLIVTLAFEQPGTMLSSTGQALERSQFGHDATAICQSVK
jgi:hypothetical protein